MRTNWTFAQKYMLPYTMNFLGTEAPDADVKKLRSGTQKFYVNCKIAAINNAKLNAETPIKTRGMDVNNKNVDGIFIDELAMGSEKPLVYFLKNLLKYSGFILRYDAIFSLVISIPSFIN